jgi:prepilin-type N-terminal cleavage/methylation domain-containing protein/prepilin-type processing-associated H-X9-DG protein
MKWQYRSREPSGFTLVELLVVMAILGALVGVLLPAVQAARETARTVQCASQLRQVGHAILLRETAQGAFPPGRIGCDDTGDERAIPSCPPGLPPARKTAASGFVAVLPFLEEQPLYDALAVDQGGLWNRNVDDLGWHALPAKARGVLERIEVLVCPSDPAAEISDVYAPVDAATASYALVQGSLGPDAPLHLAKYKNNGMFVYVTTRRASEITDGLSKTMMAGEVVLADVWESSNTWSYALVHADSLRTTRNPLNARPGSGVVRERRNGAFGSHHRRGAQFCFADGHVEFVDNAIEPLLYQAQSTIHSYLHQPTYEYSPPGQYGY